MSARLESGRLIGARYRLDVLLARGGMAEVWEASDETLGRRVAVKVLHPHLADEMSFRRRFRTEGLAAARLVHPNVVAIYDTCVDDGTDVIVMELVRGRTLRDFLDERGRLDTVEVTHLGCEVAQALSCAHRAGLVHRDIKPANILLSDDGRVLVTDFGIAKVLADPDMTSTSTMLGTVKYLAPEQVEGNPVDARTDVYALGAVLYECLCGVPPFAGETPTATALARLSQDPPVPSVRTPGVDPALDTVLRRALARDPAHRHPSAADLRAALLNASVPPGTDATAALPITSPRTPTTTTPVVAPVPYVTKRHRWRASSIAAALLVLIAVIVVALLIATTSTSRDLLSDGPVTPTTTPGTTIPISSIRSFDPDGTGPPGENDDTTANAIDADPTTAWTSETYSTRDFGNIKDGVGLVVSLPPGSMPAELRITSGTDDWAVEIFRAARRGSTLDAWGLPFSGAAGLGQTAVVELAETDGDELLLWFTDLGSGPEFRMSVAELTVVG